MKIWLMLEPILCNLFVEFKVELLVVTHLCRVSISLHVISKGCELLNNGNNTTQFHLV
jgi:hypothetical protein